MVLTSPPQELALLNDSTAHSSAFAMEQMSTLLYAMWYTSMQPTSRWLISREQSDRKVRLAIRLLKRLAYKVILKPTWTYGIQLWGWASISNIEILEPFQGKVLRIITDAPWYVPNTVLRQDLQTTSVKVEIPRFSTQYRDHLYTHIPTASRFIPPDHKRLRRHLPTKVNVYM
jgi:hypothetical protein